jgi:hypothetical protein
MRTDVESIRPTSLVSVLKQSVDRYWSTIPVLTAAFVELVTFWRVVVGHDRPPMVPDAGIFEHTGWYLAHGARLYVDIWEPKPPLPYETTAVLALLAGGDVYLLHLLNVLLMMACVCGVVALVTHLAADLTGDPLASVTAGLSMFLLAGFPVYGLYGFKAKYPLLLAGLLSIYLATNDRPFLGGAAAAASVGYWQLSLVFPCLVVGLAAQRRDWDAFARTVVGGLTFAVVMLLPVVLLWHSVPQMIAQAVVVPLAIPEHEALTTRLLAGAIHFKWASPFVLLGGFGLLRGAYRWVRDEQRLLDRRDWWLFVGAGYFAVIVLFVDFEVGGYTDLIPGLAFVALGLGVVTASFDRPDRRHLLTGAVAAVVVLNVVALGSLGLVFSPVRTPGPVPMSELQTNERAAETPFVDDDLPQVRYVYWHERTPSTCHYRLSLMELRWLERTDGGPAEGCSDLDTALAALNE